MAPSRTQATPAWDANFDTVKREKLFRNPPHDKTAYPALAEAFQPHIDSFNAVFEKNGCLEHAIKDIGTKVYLDGNPQRKDSAESRNRLSLRIKEFFLDKSTLPASNKFSATNRDVYPSECRERHSSYKGRFTLRLEYKINDGDWQETVREMGQLPIMLRSNKCLLEKFSPSKLVDCREEAEEFGGYFIVNGLEKYIRFLIATKRNYPLAISRPTFQNRGPTYTKLGIQIRSVRPDETSITNVLHYLNDGNVIFRFSWKKREYNIPAIMVMKAVVETNDREIFEGILGTADSKILEERQFIVDRVEVLLRSYKAYEQHSKSKVRAYIGSKFKPILDIPEDTSDYDAGSEFLRKIVLPHLGSSGVTEEQDADKFQMMLFMIRKLYAFVEGECAADNPDATSTQELLMGGFLYGMIIKERLEEWLNSVRNAALDWSRTKNWKPFSDPQFTQDFIPKVLRKTNEDIGRLVEYFLSTGNLNSVSGLDLQQTNGFTMVAEKLGFYRFISHFRSVHRGAFFADVRTTTVRKLLPESWGFLCPVHTPDGAPCGLLNHLSHKCKIATQKSDTSTVLDLVTSLGATGKTGASLKESVVVQLDGRILGYCTPKQARIIGDTLRYWKVQGSHGVPIELEIGYIPNSNGGQYPGIYMFSHPSRMYRPVNYLPLNKLDYVGPFEQPFMSIACTEPEIISGDSTHVEYDPTNILSIVANMTPFSDFNQSPRNMYQCQMGKQTMGTSGTAIRYRTDNKIYRLQTGQTPIARPPLHNEYGLDNFPNGTNAVVAVISYTGYDMDDAMIINKSAHDRGFGDGTIYKTKVFDLEEEQRKSRSVRSVNQIFGFASKSSLKPEWMATLDEDGLPRIGSKLVFGSYLCAYHNVSFDPSTNHMVPRDGRTEFHRYKEQEEAIVDEVRLLGSEDGTAPCHRLSIKFRVPRKPVIGDKFSSRHGQKGVCSFKYPTVDMPFSESGIVPDVIINPHAFPSRMTIGMFVESLAGKSGALHGFSQDSTPFRFEDRKGNTAVEFFGHQLEAAGYNYYGNEPMYSGITGRELAADIYMGVVYYQRLRHMVNDKFQVRTTGPIAQNTGQPIKGRSRGGGIRVGEMEKDALLAHGTAFLLQDRLLNCSDYAKAWICRTCGSFLSTTPVVGGFGKSKKGTGSVRCRLCAKRSEGWEAKNEVWEDGAGIKFTGGSNTTVVAVPGVLKYLDAELAAMGVRMKFRVKP